MVIGGPLTKKFCPPSGRSGPARTWHAANQLGIAGNVAVTGPRMTVTQEVRPSATGVDGYYA